MPERSPVWHPFTQHAVAPDAVAIARAEGAWLHTADGRAILDAISSWWVNIHGHGHPRIARAIAEQARQLEQVIFAGFTHAPAEALARKLVGIAPGGLGHVFFSDSGSTAVEVALKMAVGAWHNRGRQRRRILALEHAYHGDMFGTMAVGHRGVFSAPYDDMLFDVVRLPFPAHGEGQRTIDALANALRDGPNDFAALIVEPLVLGAGGMLIYAPDVLAEMATLCRQHNIFLIADEVMTGFGRTGTMFACEQAQVAPDLICLSKGLTGGFLPMGATLASEEIYRAFHSTDRSKTFFHSTSYTGNAIACAAAVASLEIFETEPVMRRIAEIASHHTRRLPRFADDPRVAEVRHIGTIAAIDLKVPDRGYLAGLGPRLQAFYLERNILLRPLGNTVYLLPPYCITPDELDRIYDVVADSLALCG
jgi:adenosylmethionine-8-amino-7-oxononanoate aminotransferase